MHIIANETLLMDDKDIADAIRMYARSMGLKVASYAKVTVEKDGANGKMNVASVTINHSNRDVPKPEGPLG